MNELDYLTVDIEPVRAFLDARGADWKRTVIVGFSQGALVATELIRQGVVRGEALPAAVVLLSGGLVAEHR